jgi:hypothetical protein
LPNRPFCWAHDTDPASVQRCQQAYREGGFGRANAKRAGKVVPAQLRPLFTTLVMALRDTRDGRLDPRRSAAMAALVGAMCRLFPLIDLEQRLQALEMEVRRDVHHPGA